MNTIQTKRSLLFSGSSSPALGTPGYYEDIKTYYTVAGPDYAAWSPNFNMHFGFYRKFTDLFSLEKMLINMNDEVLNRLRIEPGRATQIVDLGCGVGTVARHAAKKFPHSMITAITIVDEQITRGSELIRKDGLAGQVKIIKDNFESLHIHTESFDHAYALESACHASGSNKELFIAEMARVLKKGGSFCIADGFLKKDTKLPRLFEKIYTKILRCWALPCFGNINDFTATLKTYGLKNIKVEEISWQIAPSVAHVPWICIKFFAKELWKNKGLHMRRERWNNVYGPLLGMVLGLYRKHFGYYLISGEK